MTNYKTSPFRCVDVRAIANGLRGIDENLWQLKSIAKRYGISLVNLLTFDIANKEIKAELTYNTRLVVVSSNGFVYTDLKDNISVSGDLNAITPYFEQLCADICAKRNASLTTREDTLDAAVCSIIDLFRHWHINDMDFVDDEVEDLLRQHGITADATQLVELYYEEEPQTEAQWETVKEDVTRELKEAMSAAPPAPQNKS